MGERLEHRGRHQRGLDHGPGAGPVEHPPRRQRGQKERPRRQPPQAARHPAPRLGRVVQPDDHRHRRARDRIEQVEQPEQEQEGQRVGRQRHPQAGGARGEAGHEDERQLRPPGHPDAQRQRQEQADAREARRQREVPVGRPQRLDADRRPVGQHPGHHPAERGIDPVVRICPADVGGELGGVQDRPPSAGGTDSIRFGSGLGWVRTGRRSPRPPRGSRPPPRCCRRSSS